MGGCRSKKGPAVMASPSDKNFSGPIVVDPITRIEGHLKIEVEVENGYIKNAWSSSQLFRGLEIILQGRDPRDAQHFTQRSCGVCTYVHALASTRAVDNAVKVDQNMPPNARIMRNLVMAAQYMHDHIVHFYHLHALDFVDVVSAATKANPKKAAEISCDINPNRKATDTAEGFKAIQDKLTTFIKSGQLGIFTNAYFLNDHPAYYLPPEVNLIATAHYLQALHLQVKAARAMAIFGAKNPHTQFTVVGGVTNYDALTPKRIKEFLGLYNEVRAFIENYYIPDLITVAKYYKDWGSIGGTTNFLSFGEFPEVEDDLSSRWIPPGFINARDVANVQEFDPTQITEAVRHSWYEGNTVRHPYDGVTEPQYTKYEDRDRYSWMKAPRYMGKSTEVGPLAAMLVGYGKGHPQIKAAVDHVLTEVDVPITALFSTLGRTAARGVECLVTAQKTQAWVDELSENVAKGDTKIYQDWKMPESAEGVGFVNAPRGGLSHWIVIEGGKIKNFQLVVPSTWNLGPRCNNDLLSPVEEALVGTPIADPKRPVEILRTVHSYDPCIACGVHVIDSKTNEVYKFKVL